MILTWILFIIVLAAFGLSWCLFMIYRVDRVYEWRKQILNENLDDYLHLPPYNVMVRRFWIWNARKFLPKE